MRRPIAFLLAVNLLGTSTPGAARTLPGRPLYLQSAGGLFTEQALLVRSGLFPRSPLNRPTSMKVLAWAAFLVGAWYSDPATVQVSGAIALGATGGRPKKNKNIALNVRKILRLFVIEAPKDVLEIPMTLDEILEKSQRAGVLWSKLTARNPRVVVAAAIIEMVNNPIPIADGYMYRAEKAGHYQWRRGERIEAVQQGKGYVYTPSEYVRSPLPSLKEEWDIIDKKLMHLQESLLQARSLSADRDQVIRAFENVIADLIRIGPQGVALAKLRPRNGPPVRHRGASSVLVAAAFAYLAKVQDYIDKIYKAHAERPFDRSLLAVPLLFLSGYALDSVRTPPDKLLAQGLGPAPAYVAFTLASWVLARFFGGTKGSSYREKLLQSA